MDMVFSSWQDIPFTENHIKQLRQYRHRGNYKTNSNSIAAFDENGVQIVESLTSTMTGRLPAGAARRQTVRVDLAVDFEMLRNHQRTTGCGDVTFFDAGECFEIDPHLLVRANE